MMDELPKLTEPLVELYSALELELLETIARQFDTQDTVGGSLQWQIRRLDEMGALNAETVKVISGYSKKSEQEIYNMIKKAGFANVDKPAMKAAYRAGVLTVDPSAMWNSPIFGTDMEERCRQLADNLRNIEKEALQSVRREYVRVVEQTYAEVSSGTYDYETAIRRAMEKLADKGISGASYRRRSGKTVNYSVETAVRRDALTAVYRAANWQCYRTAELLGIEHVEVSSHVGARIHPTNPIANHAWWQGKVYKIHGFDENYGNLKNNTGYPTDILGLGGINCRHRMFLFIPDFSVRQAENYNEEEAVKAYKATQQLRAMERRIRDLKKRIAVLEASGFPVTEEKKKLRELVAKAQQFAEDNGLRTVARKTDTAHSTTLTNAAGQPTI